MDSPKHRVIMKAYINSQFGYFPLPWMMHSRSINNYTNRVYEWALKIYIRINFILMRIFF